MKPINMQSHYPQQQETTNINPYISHFLIASYGIKLADSIRRIAMYTKSSSEHPYFYSLGRSLYPIHELCAILTSLQLCKKYVLGWNDLFSWKVIAPAVIFHGMANFRGMKPIFKWNSSTPWSEIQMSPWNAMHGLSSSQLIQKGFTKLMWLILLSRLTGYCIKNYYLIR